MIQLSKRFVARIKGLFILALCTLVIALIVIFFMDAIIYPITTFAINNTKLYTTILMISFITIVTFGIIFFIIKKLITLHTNGQSVPRIAILILKSIVYYLGLILIFLIISAGVTTYLVSIVNKNMTLIYKLNK